MADACSRIYGALPGRHTAKPAIRDVVAEADTMLVRISQPVSHDDNGIRASAEGGTKRHGATEQALRQRRIAG